MANQTVYPYGTGGELPSSIGIINDLTTGGVNKALSAEMGKTLNGNLTQLGQDVGMLNLANLVNGGFPFEQGRIFGDGSVTGSTTRIRSSVAFPTPISITVPDGFLIEYAFYYDAWTSNRNFIFDHYEYPVSQSYTFDNTAPFARIVVKKTDGTDLTPDELQSALFAINTEPQIKAWILAEAFTLTSATRNSDGDVTAANVVWPDTKTGTLAITRNSDGGATRMVATHDGATYTLVITRDSNNYVTSSTLS